MLFPHNDHEFSRLIFQPNDLMTPTFSIIYLSCGNDIAAGEGHSICPLYFTHFEGYVQCFSWAWGRRDFHITTTYYFDNTKVPFLSKETGLPLIYLG